ncbi:CsbD family protein [Corynebacterium breve]|uniref:CsbD family protein n=1 Tax=Corynebacterium breve TaxID=3049799 RepID=A0ABY8VI55_9CORY|nr:CsbD family protein [Corynebacterium breve]WIM67894.1 CsbD family protein [Corynebacterium breve]
MANEKFEKLGGKIKEGAGKVTGNESLENEGRADQTKAGIKDKAKDVRDAVEDKANETLGDFQAREDADR